MVTSPSTRRWPAPSSPSIAASRRRTTDYAQGPLSRDAINSAFDNFQAQLADLQRDINSAARAKVGYPSDPLIPDPGKVLGWNASSEVANLTPASIGVDVALGDGVEERLTQDELVFYLRDYGATLNGTTYDDTAVAACIAAAEAVDGWVHGEGQVCRILSLKTLSGAGKAKWRQVKWKKTAQTAANFESMWTITGPGFSSPVLLSANVLAGAASFTLTSGTGLAADQIHLLCSTADYGDYEPSPGFPLTKNEWVRSRNVNTGTGLFEPCSPTRSSYTTATTARAYKFARTREIWFDDVEFIGGGPGLQQQALRMDYCTIKQWDNVRTQGNEYFGVYANTCVIECEMDVGGSASDLSGSGYLLAGGGCFEPRIGSIEGHITRHAFSFGASPYTTMPGGSQIYIMGQGGYCDGVHSDSSEGGPGDFHPGHNGMVLGRVTGSMRSGNAQEALTIQSPDIHVGPVRVTGADQAVVIQHVGKPTDEPPSRISVGPIEMGRGGASTSAILSIENLDEDGATAVHVDTPLVAGDFPGGIVCSAVQGDIHAHVGALRCKTRTTHSVNCIASNEGRVFLKIDHLDVTEDSGDANIAAIYADGSLWTAAHPGEPGVVIDLGPGVIIADTLAIRSIDAIVRRHPDLKITAPTYESLLTSGGAAGIGQVICGAGPCPQLNVNGDFDVWQESTSITASGYSADNWKTAITGDTTTVSRQAFSVGQVSIPGAGIYFLQAATVGAAGAANHSAVSTFIDNVEATQNRMVTISFWARDAVGAGNVALEFIQNFGSGGSPSAAVTTIGVSTIALTTPWKEYRITAFIPRINGKTLGTDPNTSSLEARFWVSAGSDFNARTNTLGTSTRTLNIKRVKIEFGPVATGYQKRADAEELALCQRRHYAATVQSENGARHIQIPVTMTAAPTVTVGVGSAGSVTANGFELSHSAAAACTVKAVARL